MILTLMILAALKLNCLLKKIDEIDLPFIDELHQLFRKMFNQNTRNEAVIFHIGGHIERFYIHIPPPTRKLKISNLLNSLVDAYVISHRELPQLNAH